MGTVYRAQAVVYSTVWGNIWQAVLTTRPAAALLATSKLRLTQDPNFNPQPGTTLASLLAQEANYSGYVAGGIAPVLTVGLNLGTIAVGALASGLFEAAPAGPFVPNNVSGWWLDDGVELVVAERFAGGLIVPFSAPGDWLDLAAILPLQLLQPAA